MIINRFVQRHKVVASEAQKSKAIELKFGTKEHKKAQFWAPNLVLIGKGASGGIKESALGFQAKGIGSRRQTLAVRKRDGRV